MNAVHARLFHAGQTAAAILGMFALGALPCHASERAEWRDEMRSIFPRGYLCRYATSPITVDGNFNKAAWALTPWTSDFGAVVGSAKRTPCSPPRATLLWA